MIIKRGEMKDASIIAKFQVLMAKETEDFELDYSLVLQGVQAVMNSQTEKGEYLVAVINEELVGCLLILPEWSDWRNKTVLWIHSVYVLPSFRTQKVFKKLFSHFEKRAQDSIHIAGIRLYVDKRNIPAIKVYEKLGMNGDHYQVFELMKS
jgi:GNAT superfamily N-acetyltransferase